jgi:hypothetical protein
MVTSISITASGPRAGNRLPHPEAGFRIPAPDKWFPGPSAIRYYPIPPADRSHARTVSRARDVTRRQRPRCAAASRPASCDLG